MKKILFSAGVVFLAISATYAQDTRTTETTRQRKIHKEKTTEDVDKIAQKKTDRINKIVNLSDDQQKAIYDIYRNEQSNQRAANHEDTRALVNATLNPEQQQKLAEHDKEKKQRMIERSNSQRSIQKAAPGKIE